MCHGGGGSDVMMCVSGRYLLVLDRRDCRQACARCPRLGRLLGISCGAHHAHCLPCYLLSCLLPAYACSHPLPACHPACLSLMVCFFISLPFLVMGTPAGSLGSTWRPTYPLLQATFCDFPLPMKQCDEISVTSSCLYKNGRLHI